jgi:hypothetical protein
MAETYCYLLFGLFLYFDGTFSILFLSRQMWGSLFDCSYRLAFLLLFKLTLICCYVFVYFLQALKHTARMIACTCSLTCLVNYSALMWMLASKLALAYTGNVDGSLLSIDQHIPSEILLDLDSSFQLKFVASKGLISVS